MAITTMGFDGTLNEEQFARLMTLVGVRYSVAGAGDFNVTAVEGNRAVSVAAGTAYAAGVAAVNSAPITVALPAPAGGAWHLIVLGRDWATNTAAVRSIPGETTSSVVPTAPPTVFPGLDSTAGVVDDQKLAWAWVNASNNNVLLFDLRDLTITFELEATATALAAAQAAVADLKEQVENAPPPSTDAKTVLGKTFTSGAGTNGRPANPVTGSVNFKY